MHLETIQSDSYLATIDLTHGANCIRLYNKKYRAEILRTPDYDDLDNPFLYGMPILFPVNRISKGYFMFEGRKYVFPINEPATGCALHGTLHASAFDLADKRSNALICRYCASEEHPYPGYSQSFEITITYVLTQKGLSQKVCIHNSSEENMPIMLGFHTTFRIPFVEGSTRDVVRVYAEVDEEYQRSASNYLPTGKVIKLDADIQSLKDGSYTPDHPISKHLRVAGRGTMFIEDQRAKCKIVYENDEKFAYRMIYGTGENFLCLEPQTCIVDALNGPFPNQYTGFTFLKPGEQCVYCSYISCEDIVQDIQHG